MNERQFGPQLTRNGVTFNLWAPSARTVDLVIDQAQAMTRSSDGWFSVDVPAAHAGTRYRFRIDGHLDVPDPASQFQPDDVMGASEVIDHSLYQWRASDWRGRPWNEAVFVETHVGTFTQQGTYRAMIDKLDHLVATGFTALELMPLADFPGRWNWGYDGVLWYAPDSRYGRPDDLKMLIDEAHLRGLMVFLDVVYNHFGPEGNYLGAYAPAFFSSAQTPWGNAIDYRTPEVRRFAIDSALNWLKNYRFDGLRLDAVHAITQPGEPHLLQELSKAVGHLSEQTGRTLHLVLENDDNCVSLLDPDTRIPNGKFHAQWNDDYHHAWHVLLTGETGGYYDDYQEPKKHLACALGSGFSYQGEASAHRDGASRGEPSKTLPPAAFVNFLQNHDQIGNRAFGDRLESNVSREAIEAALAVTLLAPMPPLMFMGDEWGTTSPFPFFCDFKGELADAVRQGRRREFQAAYRNGGNVPDALAETTYKSAQLDWTQLENPVGRARHALVRDLLAVRRVEIIPRLADCRFDHCDLQDENVLTARWHLANGGFLHLVCNLGSEAAPFDRPKGRRIWGPAATKPTLSPWTAIWSVEDA